MIFLSFGKKKYLLGYRMRIYFEIIISNDIILLSLFLFCSYKSRSYVNSIVSYFSSFFFLIS